MGEINTFLTTSSLKWLRVLQNTQIGGCCSTFRISNGVILVGLRILDLFIITMRVTDHHSLLHKSLKAKVDERAG